MIMVTMIIEESDNINDERP